MKVCGWLKLLTSNILLLSLFLLPGCFFDTRNPEAPSGGGSSWQLPTTPDLVVTNLANAYLAKNLTNYLRSFTDDFAFQADPRDTLLAPRGRYANWTRDVESQVTGALFNQGSVYLALANPQGSTGETTADRYEDYELRITGSATLYARGRAHYLLRKDADGFWAITRWEDIKTDTTDWGQLKGSYR
jgi:ketosteroid isomerase-like protein